MFAPNNEDLLRPLEVRATSNINHNVAVGSKKCGVSVGPRERDLSPNFFRSGRPRYRPLNWGAFRQKRYEGDYADRGTEVQITDFAL